MKKYKKTLPIVPPVIITIIASCVAIIVLLSWLWTRDENEWIIVGSGIVVALLIANIFILIPCGYQYSFEDHFIRISYLSITYKKIAYNKYKCAFISNASYHNNYGSGVYRNIPIQYRYRDKTETAKMICPFITLHGPDFSIPKVQSGMSSCSIFVLDTENTYCLGICWFDSLEELLSHTYFPVYVLEDVYLRFKESFDSIIIQQGTYTNRFHIVGNNGKIRSA